MLAGLAAVVVLAVVAISANRRHEGQRDQDADALWEELRQAHGLTRSQARALREAATQAGLEPKSLIFVEPHLVQRLAESPGEDGRARAADMDFQQRLFS
jgi:hypothetical protein